MIKIEKVQHNTYSTGRKKEFKGILPRELEINVLTESIDLDPMLTVINIFRDPSDLILTPSL
jgi:hypothetical protein